MRGISLIGATWMALTGARLIPLPDAADHALEGAQSGVLLVLVAALIWAETAGGTRAQRAKAALALSGAGYGIALVLEVSSVHTGFPFGTYTHHTPGPQIARVPIVAPMVYVVYGWLAWTLARALTKGPVAQIVLGALVLTSWDLSYDAIGSTVLDRYTYAHPGGFMGVPVSNFVGWGLTSLLIMTAWRGLQTSYDGSEVWRRRGRVVAAIWGVQILPTWAAWLRADDTVLHRGDRVFVTADVYGASAVVGLLVLGIPALIAWGSTMSLSGAQSLESTTLSDHA